MINKNIDIDFWNRELKNNTPEEIIDWALKLTKERTLVVVERVEVNIHIPIKYWAFSSAVSSNSLITRRSGVRFPQGPHNVVVKQVLRDTN